MWINKDVIEVLKTAQIDGEQLRLVNQLDRKLYLDTAKVLKAMGGKWVSSKKATVFPEGTDVEGTITEICETGEFTSLVKQYQYFPTPDALAKKLVELSEVSPDDICLEPSAGRGNIAKYLPNCDCIELNEDNRKYLIENGFNVIHDDFMTFEPKKKYSVIVMNPPFCKGQDARHIIKAIDLAEKAVIAIGSSGILYRSDRIYRELRDLIYDLDGTIEPLPDNSFKDSGTLVNTCLITVRMQTT